MLRTVIGRMRFIALYEGISYLILLFIAMPLKYIFDWPHAVSVVGALHGLLFVLYLFALAHVTFKHRWTLLQVIAGFVASLVPFGTFVLDSKLLRHQAH